MDPPEPGSFWASWNSFSESVSASFNEISVALAETGTVISESLGSVIEGWGEEQPSEETAQKSENPAIEILAAASVGWEEKVMNTWSAPLLEASIHIDIPRLVSKIFFEDGTGKSLFATAQDPDSDHEPEVLALFDFMAEYFKDAVFQEIIVELKEQVAQNKEAFTNLIKKVLQHPSAETSPSIKLLKGMHQKMLFPAYYYVKYLLRMPQMKDKPGTWKIFVVVTDTQVFIRHRKSQIVHAWMVSNSTPPEPDAVVIEAEWQLELEFEKASFELKNIKTTIVSGSYNDALFPDKTNIPHYQTLQFQQLGGVPLEKKEVAVQEQAAPPQEKPAEQLEPAKEAVDIKVPEGQETTDNGKGPEQA